MFKSIYTWVSFLESRPVAAKTKYKHIFITNFPKKVQGMKVMFEDKEFATIDQFFKFWRYP